MELSIFLKNQSDNNIKKKSTKPGILSCNESSNKFNKRRSNFLLKNCRKSRFLRRSPYNHKKPNKNSGTINPIIQNIHEDS